MDSKHPTVLLDHYLKQLKLPTMLREYKTIAQACAKEGQDHIGFLLRMTALRNETIEFIDIRLQSLELCNRGHGHGFKG